MSTGLNLSLAPTRPIMVLKLGGSVLRDEPSMAAGVHEISRWYRRGHQVVAVVSAFAGATDALVAKATSYGSFVSAESHAALASLGELQSGALLTLSLHKSGIHAEFLDAASIGLRTTGPALDAKPAWLDVEAVRRALARSEVLVVPGFLGRDDQNRTTLLGRGGSDMTALYLAARLTASIENDADASRRATVRCRLVKDVDGLYDRDPSKPGPAARRYARVTWDDAIAIGGKVLQEKAGRSAREHRTTFEIARAFAEDVSEVGAGPTREYPTNQGEHAPVRVLLLGAGTVGLGVAQLIQNRDRADGSMSLTGVVVRDRAKAIRSGLPDQLVTTDLRAALEMEYDLLVETIGGIEPARSAILHALGLRRPVVSANKAVIAAHGSELHAAARKAGVALHYSAAVGGGVPMLETVARVARGARIESLEGVVNATTNYVLDRVAEGLSYDEAVKEAQVAGFAEADPSRDLDGLDAMDKAVLLARAAFGPDAPHETAHTPLSASLVSDLARGAGARGGLIRHVARVSVRDGRVRATVVPEVLDARHPLALARREGNCLLVRTVSGQTHVVRGAGAGRWPTAESVFADVLDIVHRLDRSTIDPSWAAAGGAR